MSLYLLFGQNSFSKTLVGRYYLLLKQNLPGFQLGQLPELSLKILELTKSRGRISISDIVVLTRANRNTIKKHLQTLVDNNNLQNMVRGKEHGMI